MNPVIYVYLALLDVSVRILSIYKTLYGDKDGRVGMALSSLAHVKCAKGNFSLSPTLNMDLPLTPTVIFFFAFKTLGF